MLLKKIIKKHFLYNFIFHEDREQRNNIFCCHPGLCWWKAVIASTWVGKLHLQVENKLCYAYVDRVADDYINGISWRVTGRFIHKVVVTVYQSKVDLSLVCPVLFFYLPLQITLKSKGATLLVSISFIIIIIIKPGS